MTFNITINPTFQKYLIASGSRRILVCSAFALIFFLLLILQQLRPSTGPHQSLLWQDRLYSHWNHRRDGKNLLLEKEKCDRIFPGLFQEVDRSVELNKAQLITPDTLDSIKLRNGCMRVMIYDQEIYVLAAEGRIYSRGIATLLALHRAIISSPTPLPNIEFVLSTDDRLDPLPLWSYARATLDETTWLMPDFGFWSWPETKVGSYNSIQRKAAAMEDSINNPSGVAWSWRNKKKELFWRGATMNLELRKQLINVTTDKDWADVKEIIWKDPASMKDDLKSMPEHCQYRFLAHTEGNSYSGRLKYLQNCRSVIFAPKMEWIQHYTPLMLNHGKHQNFMEVARDLSDLESAVLQLRKDEKKALRIANNNIKMFRERYLSPAAQACYWRALIRGWAEVSFEPSPWMETMGNGTAGSSRRVWRGVSLESYVLERRMEWDPY